MRYMQEFEKTIITFLTEYGFRLVGATIVFVLGLLVAGWIGRMLMAFLTRKQMDIPLRMLLVRLGRLVVLALTLVLVLAKLGVEVLPLVAGLGVAGVGVGLAMQGVLGNLVAGLTIIFTKPFRLGEYVEMQGEQGQVVQIELFSTTLSHPDRSLVIIPNRKIVGEILHNFGTIRQLDLNISVAYSTNLPEAISLVRNLLSRNVRVLKDPAPLVGVTTLADSSMNLSVKPWVALPDYAPAQAELYQSIVEEFRARRVDIPLPQREVRMLSA